MEDKFKTIKTYHMVMADCIKGTPADMLKKEDVIKLIDEFEDKVIEHHLVNQREIRQLIKSELKARLEG